MDGEMIIVALAAMLAAAVLKLCEAVTGEELVRRLLGILTSVV